MPAAWSLGAITACAPAPSATRRQAPRLWGSVIPSSTSSKGGSLIWSSRSSSDLTWATAAGQLGQAQAVGLDQAHAGFAHALQELAHARITARGLEVDFDDGLGRGLEPHAHGVKAEQHFGG